MKFWPASVIASSPLVPPGYALEINQLEHRLPSEGAYRAAVDVARRTRPINAPNMVVIETVEGRARRVYTAFPETDEWLRLERGGMIETNEGFMFYMVDGLH